MRIAIVISCLVFISSCNSLNRRSKLVADLSSHFQDNYTTYEKLREYFSDDKSYLGFSFDYLDDRIKLKQGGATVKLDSISQIKGDQVVTDILLFMKEERIRDISGNSEWIKVTFEVNKFPCFSFWFKADFNPENESTIKMINNFENKKGEDWIYVLKDKWYLQGEVCF